MPKNNPPDWQGRKVVCIASGPSLTQQDCDLVQASALRHGHLVIVTNTSFRLAPWADVLFAFDAKWWREYHSEVALFFNGRKLTFAQSVVQEFDDIECLNRAPWFNNYGNSGACAIGLAIAGGADRIILLGYDCQVNGKSHWHGDHPHNWANCATIKRWPAQFKSLAMDAERDGVEIINVSRETSLKCFERMPLETVL